MKIKTIILFMLLLIPLGLIAQENGSEVPDTSAVGILAIIMPFATWGITWMVKKLVGVIPGWSVLLLVTGLSALGGWIVTQQGLTDLSWLAVFGLGLASVFINEFKKALSAKK